MDVELKLIILDAKVADAKAGILREHPVPMMPDPESTEEIPLPDIPQYTDKNWITKLIRDYLFREYKEGKRKLANDVAIIYDIFEEG